MALQTSGARVRIPLIAVAVHGGFSWGGRVLRPRVPAQRLSRQLTDSLTYLPPRAVSCNLTWLSSTQEYVLPSRNSSRDRKCAIVGLESGFLVFSNLSWISLPPNYCGLGLDQDYRQHNKYWLGITDSVLKYICGSSIWVLTSWWMKLIPNLLRGYVKDVPQNMSL